MIVWTYVDGHYVDERHVFQHDNASSLRIIGQSLESIGSIPLQTMSLDLNECLPILHFFHFFKSFCCFSYVHLYQVYIISLVSPSYCWLRYQSKSIYKISVINKSCLPLPIYQPCYIWLDYKHYSKKLCISNIIT